MVEHRWRPVVDGLRARRTPLPEQVEVAAKLNVRLDPKWPSHVAAACLRAHLGASIGHRERPTKTEAVEYAVALARSLRVRIPVDHQQEADLLDGWIAALHDLRAERRLRNLRPSVGDIVAVDGKSFAPDELPLAEVASFSADGQLNFRGGLGARARPHRVEIIARVGDPAHTTAQLRAARIALERRGRLPALSEAQRSELEPFYIHDRTSVAAVSALEEALVAATDEAPLQRVLEHFPELLAALFTANHGLWVIPRPQLAGKHVPDFLVATQTSAGVRWTLIELESPTEKLHMRSGHLAKAPRQGIAQIEDWRQLILTHQPIVERPRSEGGWGFPGLRSDSQGLVIVGRGAATSMTDVARHAEATQKNIDIRTYDWMLGARRPVAGIGVLDAERLLDDPF